MELPILAFTLVRKFRPMIIGSDFGMVDVGGNDGAAARDLAAHEFGRHLDRESRRRSELPSRERGAARDFRASAMYSISLVTMSGAGIFKLRDALAGLRAQGLEAAARSNCGTESSSPGFSPSSSGAARGPHIPRRRRARESIRGAARRGPCAMSMADAFIRVRTGCVVEPDRRFAARQRHFAERHAARR